MLSFHFGRVFHSQLRINERLRVILRTENRDSRIICGNKSSAHHWIRVQWYFSLLELIIREHTKLTFACRFVNILFRSQIREVSMFFDVLPTGSEIIVYQSIRFSLLFPSPHSYPYVSSVEELDWREWNFFKYRHFTSAFLLFWD